MLGPAFLNLFGILPQSPWIEWRLSFAFVLIVALFIRQLIWLCSPPLRKDRNLRAAGFRVDGILVLWISFPFLMATPLPIYGNSTLNFVVGVLFITLGLRLTLSALNKVFSSEHFAKIRFPEWRLRVHKLARLGSYMIAAYFALRGTPLAEFLSTWTALLLFAFILWSAREQLRDFMESFSRLHSPLVTKGTAVELTLSEDKTLRGTISSVGWCHLSFAPAEGPASTQILVRWRDIRAIHALS